MGPHERFRTAIEHREPDKVPIDLGGIVTGISTGASAALMVGLITSGLKLGDRSQLGALVLAASLVGNLLLMIAVSVWAVAEGGMDQAVSTGLMVTIVSLGYGALAANAVSVAVLVSDTLMSRQ